jgi:3-hydroxybutyryl-CoA dehydrogenase
MDMHVAGVAGAGVIGAGVAQDLAAAGLRVMLLDVTEEILARACREIDRSVRFQRLYRRDLPTSDPQSILSRITCVTDPSALCNVDFVIENVTEQWTVKSALYGALDAICHGRTMFMVNTSVFPIARVAALTGRPANVIGVHFMNPVPLTKLVEVICGDRTSAETLAATQALLTRMRKDWILVKDTPGFVSNRVLMVMINEAIRLVDEGIASPDAIDRLFVGAVGHAMGPLATADLIGLDTVLHSLEGLYAVGQDPRYVASPRLVDMVRHGRHGQKTGEGFFTYPVVD